MSIPKDFSDYIDGNGLMTPEPDTSRNQASGLKGSDNGPMYTGEYYVILAKQGVLTDYDKNIFITNINNCIDSNGILNRVPRGQTDGQEQCDDYYGVLNACIHLANTSIPRTLLWATLSKFGFLNNVPGTPNNGDNWLIRQPALIPSLVSASFPSLSNPLHWFTRLLFLPGYILTAVVIAIACRGDEVSSTDSRRLSWHVMQINKKVSLLCKLTSFIWLKRLYKDYGPLGMRAVAAIYYNPKNTNPYAKHWITE